MTAHWGVPDPAAVAGTPEEIEKAFRDAFMILDRRISLFLCLPAREPRQARHQKRNRPHRPAMKFSLPRRLVAEFLGTAFLVAAVVGSGIMGERLAGGNVAIALLANTIATGAALVALILAFGPISGAHLNPAVSLAEALERRLPWSEALTYMLVQMLGGIGGAIAAHLMFRLPYVSLSRHVRGGPAMVFSEFVATFGLLAVIRGMLAARPKSRRVRRRRLHHCRLLVHRIHFVCQSGRNHRPLRSATRSPEFVPWMSPIFCLLKSPAPSPPHSCSAGSPERRSSPCPRSFQTVHRYFSLRAPLYVLTWSLESRAPARCQPALAWRPAGRRSAPAE